MIRLLWRTDVHISDHTPRSRKDNWTETILRKLKWCGELANEHKCDAVIDGGDFFDIKSPSRNSHQMVQQVAEIHEDYVCPTYVNVGNHDVKYGDIEYLGESPLGVLFSSGVFQRLYDQHELIITNEHRGPDNREPIKVRVVGIPYHGTEYDWERFASIKKGDEDYLIVIAHVLASKKGGSMFEGEDIIRYSSLADLDPDVWAFGHWHKDQGIEEIAPGKWVVNVGSFSRGSLSQDSLTRKPCAVLMEFGESIRLERHNVPILEPEKVFDVEAKQRAEERTEAMETFMTQLQNSMSDAEEGSSLESVIQGANVADKVKEIALMYLEQA